MDRTPPEITIVSHSPKEEVRNMVDDIELNQIQISQDENMDTSPTSGMYENKGVDITIDEIDADKRTSSDSSISKPEADRAALKREEREFYLYTVDGESEIVAAEVISYMEYQMTMLPGLTTQIVDRISNQIANRKSQLRRINNSYWKPPIKKRTEINEFISTLIQSGDIQLIKRAYTQFPIIDNVLPSPFTKEKKLLPDHESILHMCARYGDGDIMLNLLKAKSQYYPLDVRSNKSGKGSSILHAAVNEGNADTVNAIANYAVTENEEKIFSTTKSVLGRGSLGRGSLGRSFLSRDSKEEPTITSGKDLLNLVNGNNEAAVHLCVHKKYYSILEILLNADADLRVQDKYGHNVLHEAAIQNDSTTLNIIIQHLKDQGEEGEMTLKNLLMTTSRKGANPTELASDIDTVRVLVSCIDEEMGRSEQLGMLLASATERNNIEIATFLVSKGASIDFENKHGMTPLKLASLRGYNELANYMLKEGGNPNQIQGSKSNAAINNAAMSGHLDLVKMLIEYKASLWDDTIMEQSALHSAVNGGHSNLIRYLVDKKKMDPNTRDIHGKTPLCYAVEGGYRDCVKELLNCRADPELPVDEYGHKAVHLAAKNNNRSILKILLDFGAKSDERDKRGKAPIDIAIEKDSSHILGLLLEYKVSLERDNSELNTPMHTIALFDSYKCADYLLREAKIKTAFKQLNDRNVDKETPIDIAKRKGHDSVLITYIERVHKDYFAGNPKIYHEFLEAEKYDILKKIFDRMCEEKKGGTKIHCTAKMLDTNGKGQTPFSKNFSHSLPSLLHKLIECDDKELREHPIVKKTVEKKLSFYRIWYTITFLLYLAFVVALSISLFLASYECDSDLTGIQIASTGSSIRVFLETTVWIFASVLTFSEMVEFAYGWSKIFKSQRLQLNSGTHPLISIESDEDDEEVYYLKDQRNYFLQLLGWVKKTALLIPLIDRSLCYLPRAILSYLYDSIIDIIGIVTLFLYFFIRFSEPNVAWIFASLAFIAFTITLLKYTRIIPSLGAYIDTVKAVFSKDIPRFLVLYIIVLIAFIGGIHLAARFNTEITPQTTRLSPLGRPEDSCLNETSEILFFNDKMTNTYTIIRPFVTGLILLMDGGPGNREDELFNVNLYLAIIYLLFSFTIIVVLSNILIAQLSETYAALSSQGTFYYRMGLIVTMELESSIAFFLGKYFRQLASIRTFNVPIDEWKHLLNKTPDANINQHLDILEDKITKNIVSVNEGNEKALTQMEFLVSLGEKVDEVQKKMEHLKMNFDPSEGIDSLGAEQPTAKEMFAKVKMERRIGILESSVEQIANQSTTMGKKLNQILDLLKK